MKVIAASLAPYQESAMIEDSKPDMFINPRYPGATPEMVGPALRTWARENRMKNQILTGSRGRMATANFSQENKRLRINP